MYFYSISSKPYFFPRSISSADYKYLKFYPCNAEGLKMLLIGS